jgi:pimeloyl-ACP methyl ester carboxylesterase
LPPPEPQVLKMMMSTPKYGSREDLIAHQVAMFQCIGSPGYPTPAALLTEQVALAHDRGYSRNGVLRQSLAVMADTARAKELAHLHTPTLVIHGKADPLLPYVHGADTAKRIAGAQLIGIEGMGHDLPTGAMDQFMPALLMHLHKHNPPALQPSHEPT